MKVLYDHQTFTVQAFGGISRYFAELFRYSQQTHLFEMACAVRYSNNVYLKQLEWLPVQPIETAAQAAWLGECDFIGKAHLYRAQEWLYRRQKRLGKRFGWKIMRDKLKAARGLNQRYAEEMLDAGDFDLFHPTYYDPYFLDHLGNKPFVLTIYDMIHEVFPEYFPPEDHTSDHKKLLASRAAVVIAISESTKNDLVKLLHLPQEKVRVIYLGNSIDIRQIEHQPPARQADLPHRYLLFTGNRAMYKNFYFLLRALTDIFQEDPSLHLVCNGPQFTRHEQHYIEHLDLTGRVHYSATPTDQELIGLYQHAQAFIFPSLYEGFGMPVLEAFACGCPAVLSKTSSLLEIGGDAAMYFAPKDQESIHAAVRQVLSDQGLRQELIERGRQRVLEFSWNRTAQETGHVYQHILN
jgi:glycosyltransferase involved in cell wall biosynthesis